MSNKSVSIRQCVLLLILLFPVTSILKVYIGPLNLIVTTVTVLFIMAYYLRCGVNGREVLLLGYIFLIVASNCVQYRMHFYNSNMLLYFPFYIIYYLFIGKNWVNIIEQLRKHRVFIDRILYVWNFMVALSFFIPSCYTYEGEDRGFVSFAGTTFLLCPIAIFVFVLLAYQYILYQRKKYICLMVVPSLCVLLGTTRTYLVVLLCAWAIFLYAILKNKKHFFGVLILFAAVAIVIVAISPVKDKFITAAGRTETTGQDFWYAFTSGRSAFWAYDMNAIMHNSLDKILFGNGINYLFYLNKPVFKVALWAHNDYIQILSDYGLLGLFIYVYMIYYVVRNILEGIKPSRILMCCLIMLWAFNAFFNMFYTYFCATLSFPFFVLLVRMGTTIRLEENM